MSTCSMKRNIIIILLSLLPMLSWATIISGYCGSKVSYRLEDDGTLYIEGSGKMKNYGWINYQAVNAPWYSYASQIYDISIAEGVTSIGDYAFDNCSIPNSVVIPNTVTSIGSYAFTRCIYEA